VHFILHFGAEGPDSSLHLHFVGNDVIADATMDGTDCDDRGRCCNIKLPARNGLNSQDYLRSNHNWIHARPWRRAVRLFSFDCYT
jgi:hypothetical protein